MSETNDNVAATFANAIRMGDMKGIQYILENKPADILHSRMSFRITLQLSLADWQHNKQRGLTSKNPTLVKLIVTPIHIAIIAKQQMAVEVILRHFMKPGNTISNNKEEVLRILNDKTEVQFQADPTIYSPNDRVLDGMNVLHLAAQFSPQSLDEIFKLLKQDVGITRKELQSLLEQKDPHLKQTPLHIAARMPNSFATQ